MSRKRTVYSAEFKTRLVLEVLREEKTLNEIASANNINPKNLQNWKNISFYNLTANSIFPDIEYLPQTNKHLYDIIVSYHYMDR